MLLMAVSRCWLFSELARRSGMLAAQLAHDQENHADDRR